MSNNIGELFKFLGNNETFTNYIKEIENGKSINEIVDLATNDEELMEKLTALVSDVSLIKNKMEVLIGQKKKSFDKKNETNAANSNKKQKLNDSSMETATATATTTTTDPFSKFSYKPFDVNNTVFLDENIYLERIDLRLRLVTTEFELYY